MHALVVSNMRPDADHPERGRFVRDQVTALSQIAGLEVELHEIPPGAAELARGLRQLWQTYRGRRFDVVHAHFSLSALPALGVRGRLRGVTLHGTDVRDPRTRVITRAVLPLMDLVVAVSSTLAAELPGRRARRRARVIPSGVDITRFHPIPREQARRELGLDPGQPQLLFPADPARAAKRHDRAAALAEAVDVPLITLGGVRPERVPLLLNAANAMIAPSDAEGFGLAVLEALACDVPVLATPVGIHREALAGVEGTLCAPFELRAWQQALAPHLRVADPRIEGQARAARYSAAHAAGALAAAWAEMLR